MEGLLLGLVGARSRGLLLSRLVLGSLPVLLPLLGGATPGTLELAAGSVVLGVSSALAVVIAFSAFPLWLATRVELVTLMRSSTFARSQAFRFRRFIIVGQIALSLVVLQTTLLLARSFHELLAVDPGFEARHALTFGIGLPEARYDTGAKLLGFHRRLITRLEEIPGVTSAGAGTGRLLSGRRGNRIRFRHGGEPLRELDWPHASVRLASPGYFRAMGIPLVRGRRFSWDDDLDQPRVIAVNRAFERSFFANGGALGKRLELELEDARESGGDALRDRGRRRRRDAAEPAQHTLARDRASRDAVSGRDGGSRAMQYARNEASPRSCNPFGTASMRSTGHSKPSASVRLRAG